MRRKIVLFIIIAICFLLQTTVFRALTFANIGPNLLIIVVSSFGLMRGKKEGLWVGFFLDCLSTYFLCFGIVLCFCLSIGCLLGRQFLFSGVFECRNDKHLPQMLKINDRRNGS